MSPSTSTTERATTAQRDYVRRLLRKLEYDMRTCSLPHRAVATRAGLTTRVPESGTGVDEWLDTLTKGQAGDLINALLRECA